MDRVVGSNERVACPPPAWPIAAAMRTTRAQGHGHGVGDLVDANLQPAAGLGVENNLLGIPSAHSLRFRRAENRLGDAAMPLLVPSSKQTRGRA